MKQSPDDQGSFVSESDECEINLNGNDRGNIHYARNASVYQRYPGGAIRLRRRWSVATINEFDE